MAGHSRSVRNSSRGPKVVWWEISLLATVVNNLVDNSGSDGSLWIMAIILGDALCWSVSAWSIMLDILILIQDRKSTRLNSSHVLSSRMLSSA